MHLGEKIPRDPAKIRHRAAPFGVGFVGLEAPFLDAPSRRQNRRSPKNSGRKPFHDLNKIGQGRSALPVRSIKYNVGLIAQIQLPQQKFLFE